MKITETSLYSSQNYLFKSKEKPSKIESNFGHIFFGIVEQIITFLLGSSEPKIWQNQTRKGELIWHIYDPITRKTEQFISEKDVRIWIENHYYR